MGLCIRKMTEMLCVLQTLMNTYNFSSEVMQLVEMPEHQYCSPIWLIKHQPSYDISRLQHKHMKDILILLSMPVMSMRTASQSPKGTITWWVCLHYSTWHDDSWLEGWVKLQSKFVPYLEASILEVPPGMFTTRKGGMANEFSKCTIKVKECIFYVYVRQW